MYSAGQSASTHTTEYPQIFIGTSLAVIFVLYNFTLNTYLMLGRDQLLLEEWSIINPLPIVYKLRKEEFIKKRVVYYLDWHAYIIYMSLVCFYVSFYALQTPSSDGFTSTVFS